MASDQIVHDGGKNLFIFIHGRWFANVEAVITHVLMVA
jgi:hypothetical protein